MITYKIKVAGIVIKIEAQFHRMWNICQPYLVDDSTEPDFTVHCCEADLDHEATIYESHYRHSAPSDVYLEEYAMLRLVADRLINYNTLTVHGSAIGAAHDGFVFLAPSGIGKTTHVKKWLNRCDSAFVINGDKPFLSFCENEATPPLICASPWAGKENMYTNTMVPLKSIILMERAENNHIEKISFAEAFPSLLQQVYRSADEQKMRKTLHLMQRLSPTVTFWRFQCNNFKDDCFDVAYNALVRNQP